MTVGAYIELHTITKGMRGKYQSLISHVVSKYTATVLTMGGPNIGYQRGQLPLGNVINDFGCCI